MANKETMETPVILMANKEAVGSQTASSNTDDPKDMPAETVDETEQRELTMKDFSILETGEERDYIIDIMMGVGLTQAEESAALDKRKKPFTAAKFKHNRQQTRLSK